MKATDFLKEMDGLPEETVLQNMPESMRNAAPYRKHIQTDSAADMPETDANPEIVRSASGRAHRIPYYLIGGCAAACVCGLVLLFHQAKPETVPVQIPATATSEAITEMQNTAAAAITVTEIITTKPETKEPEAQTSWPSDMTLLPSLNDQKYYEVKRTLEENDLHGQFCWEYSDTVPAGSVIRSEPEGMYLMEKGAVVTVYLSRGKEGSPVTVPQFIGCGEKEACLLAETYGLNAVFEDYTSGGPVGMIMEQSLEPDTEVAANTEIVLYVSNSDSEKTKPKKTSGSVQMPDVTGKNYEDICGELLELGLRVKMDWEFSDTVPADTVIGSDPAGPCKAEAGSVVLVRCSRGKDMSESAADGTVRLPDIQGYNYDDVRDRLAELGLRVEMEWEYSDTVTEGKVISSTPGGVNEVVAKGSLIRLRVSRGPDRNAVRVPDFVGHDEETASRMAEAGSLNVVIKNIGGSSQAGTVMQQSIEPNTVVTAGTEIVLYVSNGNPE